MLELLCVAHRIIALDDRPRRHSGDRTSPIPIATGEVSPSPLCARDRPGSSPLLAVLVPRRFLAGRSLTLRQRGTALVVAECQVALSRCDPDRAIHISHFKLGPNTRGW